jgi:nucleoside-diphosphate-sugar epimerase
MPRPILVWMARLGDLANYLLPFPLTSDALERLTGSLDCSTAKLQAATGYRPRWTTEQGLQITADWYNRPSTAQPSLTILG